MCIGIYTYCVFSSKDYNSKNGWLYYIFMLGLDGHQKAISEGDIVLSNVRLLETAESLAETSSIEFKQCCIFTTCY